MSRAKNWCFTLNNYTLDDLEHLDNICQTMGTSQTFGYLIFGKEICPTTGTPHLQGYVQFKKKLRMAQVKECFKSRRINVRVANGTALQNQMYCMKDSDYVEFGECVNAGMYIDLAYMRLILRDPI